MSAEMKILRLPLLFASLLLPIAASAQAYPVKPVHVVLRVAPGGLQDSLARAIAVDLGRIWGQSVVVENRPSAGGIAAGQYVARSPADGYTMLQSDNVTPLVNELLRSSEKVPFDIEKDFTPALILVSSKNIAVASNGLKVANFREFVALAKQKPGSINFGSSGVGSSFHIDAEALAREAGIRMNHVPYKGGAPLLQALLANELDFSLVGTTAAIPLVRAGKIRALGYGGLQRLPVLPDVPTLAEQGLPGFDSSAWWWWLVPTGTPRAVVDKIAADTGRVLSAPEFRERHINAVGHELMNVPGAKALEIYAEDRKLMAARVKPLNLKLD